MKLSKILAITAIMTGTLTGLTSCGSDPVAAIATAASKGTMSATIDGQGFTANLSTVKTSSSITTISGGIVGSSGTTGTTKQLTFSGNLPATGTYVLGNGGIISANPIAATYSEASSTVGGSNNLINYGATTGELKITELTSSKIKGTFNFSGYDLNSKKTITVANGVFDINF